MNFDERTTEANFLNLVAQLKNAITITEVEKAYAIFKTFAVKQSD